MKTLKYFLIICLVLLNSCEKVETGDSNEKFIPTDVLVKTKGYYTIDKIFNFIDSFDHDVEYIEDGIYTSGLPSDSLQYVLDYLNAKSYTHDGNAWFVTGYLHYQTQVITIFPKLFNIKNKENQLDWLKSMKTLRLTEQTDNVSSGNIIYFHVPDGKEREWVRKFEEYSFVEWAELNSIEEINPSP